MKSDSLNMEIDQIISEEELATDIVNNKPKLRERDPNLISPEVFLYQIKFNSSKWP